MRKKQGQADQDLNYPLKEPIDTVVYVDEIKMLRSDCMDAHAGPTLSAYYIRALFVRYAS